MGRALAMERDRKNGECLKEKMAAYAVISRPDVQAVILMSHQEWNGYPSLRRNFGKVLHVTKS
jgi:hypothetical protein